MEGITYSDVLHDSDFNYYGQLLATAGSNQTVTVYVVNPQLRQIAVLTGHEGPVWRVRWAHPRFGNVIASCSYDHKVIIWKEQQNGWRPVHVVDSHKGSVNAIDWAPQNFGSVLGSASSDGTVGLTLYNNGSWQESMKVSNNANMIAHAMGATCISFAPSRFSQKDMLVFATGGCDSKIRIWIASFSNGVLGPVSLFHCLEAHSDWVHDVAFAPIASSLPYLLLASCGKDNKICVFRKSWKDIDQDWTNNTPSSQWEQCVTPVEEGAIKLSWVPSTERLIVTSSRGEVFSYSEGRDFEEPWSRVAVNN